MLIDFKIDDRHIFVAIETVKLGCTAKNKCTECTRLTTNVLSSEVFHFNDWRTSKDNIATSRRIDYQYDLDLHAIGQHQQCLIQSYCGDWYGPISKSANHFASRRVLDESNITVRVQALCLGEIKGFVSRPDIGPNHERGGSFITASRKHKKDRDQELCNTGEP